MQLILILGLLGSLNGNWTTLLNADYIFDFAEKDGLLYLATNGGVVIYDPAVDSVIKQFTNLDGLSGPVVTEIEFTTNGCLWAAVSEKGLAYMPEGCDFFYTYPLSGLPASITDTRDMLALSDTLFFATRSGLVVLDTKGTANTDDDSYTVYTSYTSPLSSDNLFSLALHRDTLYIGSASGLDIVPVQGLDTDSAWNHMEEFSEGDTVLVIEPVEGFIGLGVNDRAYIITADTTHLLLDSLYIMDMAHKGDTLYIAAFERSWGNIRKYGGVFRALPDGSIEGLDRTEDWKTRGISVYVSADGSLLACFGWFWIPSSVSYATGLSRFTDDGWQAHRLSILPFNKITSIVKDDSGTIWIASCTGYYPWAMIGFKKDGEVIFPDTAPGADDYHPNAPYIMKKGPDGKVWVGTWWSQGGVYKVDFDGSIILHFNGFQSNFVKSIDFLPDGTPLVACYPYNGQGGGVWKLTSDTTYEMVTDVITMIEDIAVDHLGRLWVGGAGGCYVLGNNDTIVLRTTEGLPNDNVLRLKRDGDAMWIGTSDGLAFYRDGRIQRVYLQGYEIKDIDPSPCGRVFVLTDQGLAVLRPETGEIEDFLTPANSLLINDMTVGYVTNALFVDPYEGKIWIGSKHGLSVLDVDFFEHEQKGNIPYVYPNPWIKGVHSNIVTIGSLRESDEVYLFTLSGKRIDLDFLEFTKRQFSASFNPEKLASGTYLLLIKHGDGSSKTVKFAVVK